MKRKKTLLLILDQNLYQLLINANNLAVIIIYLYISLDGKGKSVNLLKDASKRKRRREELEEVKDEEIKLKQNK